MSLAELKGTPKASTFKVNTNVSPKYVSAVQTVKTAPKGTVISSTPKSKQPLQFVKAGIGLSLPSADVVWGGLQIIGNIAGFNTLTPAKAPVSTVSNKVTKILSPAQQSAIDQAWQRKYGTAVISSPSNIKTISTIKTLSVLATLKKSGLEVAPAGTSNLVYTAQEQALTFRNALNSLMTQQEEWTVKQAQYQSALSQSETVLAKATSELGVTKGQLQDVTASYLDLQQRYQQLLGQGGGGGQVTPAPDLLGGIGDFIKTYGIWIALGIGAIILLPSLLRRSE